MLPQIWHRNIFLFGIIGLSTGMLFGTVPTSIPQIILAANWLLEHNFSWKWRKLKSNKIVWILMSFFLLHVIGMLYTQNTAKGFDDLRNKIPILILPLIFFSTKPLSFKELRLLLACFFLSVFISSICCYIVYAGYTKKVIIDIRQASIFMSHIRFSLFIAFAVIGLIYTITVEKKRAIKIVCGLMALWLLFFMYTLEMATGFICLLVVSAILMLLFSFHKFRHRVSIALIFSLCIGMVLLTRAAMSSLSMYDGNVGSPANKLLVNTKNHRLYHQDTLFKLAENGTYITVNVNEEELKQEWKKRSKLPFEEKDKKGNSLRYTIMRYLSSKSLPKDSVGIISLSDDDIRNIEKGYSNYKYTQHGGLKARWRELVWEYTKYKRGENPSGHTFTMRIEFWKTACYIIARHPLIGVGTGDIQDEFNQAYHETNSKLTQEWRLRCHNQYLAVGVAFGITGLVIFLFYLVYPAFSLRKQLHDLYWPFLLIALLSFLTEDTLETQSGVTFFMFFQALFLWLASTPKESENIPLENLPK